MTVVLYMGEKSCFDCSMNSNHIDLLVYDYEIIRRTRFKLNGLKQRAPVYIVHIAYMHSV
jgi:hypothetical protein